MRLTLNSFAIAYCMFAFMARIAAHPAETTNLMSTIDADLDSPILPTTLPTTLPTNETSVDPYAAVYGTKHLVKRGVVLCKTTNDSPLIGHITVGILALQYRGGTCRQSHVTGRCMRLLWAGTANLYICGWLFRGLPCTEVARGVKEVRDRCNVNGRAAGEWDFNDTPMNARVD